MDDGSSGLVTIQLDPYMFLTQNYIRLESNSFRARSLDNLFQNLNFFIYHPSSTPYQYNPEDTVRPRTLLLRQGLLYVP